MFKGDVSFFFDFRVLALDKSPRCAGRRRLSDRCRPLLSAAAVPCSANERRARLRASAGPAQPLPLLPTGARRVPPLHRF